MALHNLTITALVGNSVPFPEHTYVAVKPAFQWLADDESVNWSVAQDYDFVDGVVTIPGMEDTDQNGDPVTWQIRVVFEKRGQNQGGGETVQFEFNEDAPTDAVFPRDVHDVDIVQPGTGPSYLVQTQILHDQVEVYRDEVLAVGNTNDTIIKGLIENPASQTATALSATIGDVIDADVPALIGPGAYAKMIYTLPSQFTFDPGFRVWFDGRKYTTDFDASARRNLSRHTYVVNIYSGSDTTGDGSAARPWATLDKAITMAAEGDRIIVPTSGIFFISAHAEQAALNKSLDVIATSPFETMLVRANPLTWAANATYPNVFESAQTNVRKVVDFGLDPTGADFPRVASLALCNSTPGSFFQATDGTGSIYVHTPDNSAPGSLLFALLPSNWLNLSAAGRTSDMRFYIEGFTIIGGDDGSVVINNSTAYWIYFTAKDCKFFHSGYGAVGITTAAGLRDSLTFDGHVNVVLQNVEWAHTCVDGVNYGPSGAYDARFVEIDCHGHDCGTGWLPQSLGVSTACNASTAHAGGIGGSTGVMGIQIGCDHGHTYGAPIGHVQNGTKVIMMSCRIGDSVADDPTGSSHKAAINVTQGTAEVWVLACITYGAAVGGGTAYGLWSADGAIIHYDELTEATRANTGTGTYVLEHSQ